MLIDDTWGKHVEILTRQSVGLGTGAMVLFNVVLVDLQLIPCVGCRRRSRLLSRSRWDSADLIEVQTHNAKSDGVREIGSAPEVWVAKFFGASSQVG
jgi:hypothetical protein